jgi:hypothetical protein
MDNQEESEIERERNRHDKYTGTKKLGIRKKPKGATSVSKNCSKKWESHPRP